MMNQADSTNSQIKFKTSMLKSSLCDYSDGYIIVKGTLIDKQQEIDNARDIDTIMPIYNLIEHEK